MVLRKLFGKKQPEQATRLIRSPSQLYLQYPLGIRIELLRYYEDPRGDFLKDVLPINREAERLENPIINRNLTGSYFEAHGKLDEAIKLYEENIAALTSTPHPYERLRIIYTKQKKYDQAMRVCQAYIQSCEQLGSAIRVELKDIKLAERMAETGKFPYYISRINLLIEKAN